MVRDASLSPLALAGDLGPGISGDEVVRGAVPFFAARLGVVPPDPGLVSVAGEGELRVLDLHAVGDHVIPQGFDQVIPQVLAVFLF
jgi:hypothetical protein